MCKAIALSGCSDSILKWLHLYCFHPAIVLGSRDSNEDKHFLPSVASSVVYYITIIFIVPYKFLEGGTDIGLYSFLCSLTPYHAIWHRIGLDE